MSGGLITASRDWFGLMYNTGVATKNSCCGHRVDAISWISTAFISYVISVRRFAMMSTGSAVCVYLFVSKVLFHFYNFANFINTTAKGMGN